MTNIIELSSKIKSTLSITNKNPDISQIIYDRKMGENPNTIPTLLNSLHQEVLIIADTNAGKTFTCNTFFEQFNLLHPTTKSINIILTPNKVQNLQNESKYPIMRALVEGIHLTDCLTYSNCISAVYDKSDELSKYILSQLYSNTCYHVNLFIDEAHRIVEDWDFRDDALLKTNELIDITRNAKNGSIFYMTATPAHLCLKSFDKIIHFKSPTSKPYADNIKFVQDTSSGTFVDGLVSYIVSEIQEGNIPLVRYNDKDNIEYIVKKLAERGYNTSYISADTKGYTEVFVDGTVKIKYKNKMYGEIINHSTLPRYDDNGRFIHCYLCTSVLDVGTNLESIECEENPHLLPIYVCGNMYHLNFTDIKQFFGRVRYNINSYIFFSRIGAKSNLDYQNLCIQFNDLGYQTTLTNKYLNIYSIHTQEDYDITKKICDKYNVVFRYSKLNNRIFIQLGHPHDINEINNNEFSNSKLYLPTYKKVLDSYKELCSTDAKTIQAQMKNMLNLNIGSLKNDLGYLIYDTNTMDITYSWDRYWKLILSRFTKQFYCFPDELYEILSKLLNFSSFQVLPFTSSSSLPQYNNIDKLKLEQIFQAILANEQLLDELNKTQGCIPCLEEFNSSTYTLELFSLLRMGFPPNIAISLVINKIHLSKSAYEQKVIKMVISALSPRDKDLLQSIALHKYTKPKLPTTHSEYLIDYIYAGPFMSLITFALENNFSLNDILDKITKSSDTVTMKDCKNTIQHQFLNRMYFTDGIKTLPGPIGKIHLICLEALYIPKGNSKSDIKNITINDSVISNVIKQLHDKANIDYSIGKTKKLISYVFKIRANNVIFGLNL